MSEEKLPCISRRDNCSVQTSCSLRSRSETTYYDPDTDQQATAQFDVPGDGSCLFWAVTLAYLIPVKDDDTWFQLRYMDLMGNDETVVTKMVCVRTSIHNYNPLSRSVPKDDVFKNLVRNTFRNRVVDFMGNNLDKFEYFSEVADERYRFNMRNPDTWSGDPEIQAISLILNCRINVDGQNFPVISNNEEVIHDLKRITLELFRVNWSTGDAQNAIHYNYGLEIRLLEYFRETLIDNILKLLGEYSCENSKIGTQDHVAGHDCDSGNNSSDNSEEYDIALENRNVIDTKVMYRVNNEVKFEAVWEHELVKLLEEYQADCNQPVSEDSIRMMCCLFQEPKHVAGIFGILKDMSEENDILKCAFIVLKIVIDELYNTGNYDLVILIANVKEVNSVKKAFLQNDSSDMDVLQFNRIVAQTLNKEGFHEDALEILYNIIDKIMHIKSSNISDKPRIENIDSGKFYFSLLISSDIAYTKHLMGECEESYNEYKTLHDQIVKHLRINRDSSRLSYKIYKDIFQSENYQNMLALHREYLSILDIRSCIAHELVCLGNINRNSLRHKDCGGTFNKAVNCFQDALNLHEDNFQIKRIDPEFLEDVRKEMRDIAIIYTCLGNLYYLEVIGQNQTITSLNEALNFYYKAFEMHSVSLSVTCPELWTTHPVNSKFVKDITWLLNKIALIHKKCGNLKYHVDSNAAIRNLENALNIFENLCKFHKNNLGEEHKYTLNLQEDIAFLSTKLGHLKSRYYRYNPKEASRHYEKAYEINQELFEIKRRTLGTENQSTLKIESYINKTKAWINDLNYS